jgi:hypothetical protein
MSGKLTDNSRNGIRLGGTIFGVTMAVVYAKGWTAKIIWVASGVGVGFAVPEIYDYAFST